jgi:peptidoglycan DL-endopeptidase CwlO
MASAKCRLFCRALPFFLIGAATLVGVPVAPAGATTQSQIAATEAQVAALETTIANEQQQSAALDQQYLAAKAKVQQFQAALATTQQQLTSARARVKADRARLNRDAVYAYIYNEPISKLDSAFTDSPAGSEDRNQYVNVVVGNISVDVASLAIQQGRLTTVSRLEQSEAQQANSAVAQVNALEAANQQAAAAAQATLNQVKGNLAVQVAAYAEQQAEAQAALAAANPSDAGSAARNATQDATVAVALVGVAATGAVTAANNAAAAGGAPPVAGSATGSGAGAAAGAAAVAAAESQLGVPYVWGGESPGIGFDCSGLTQWSWSQAGVSIPRVAVDQAAAVPQAPLNALEPGDLLFYYNLDGDSTIDHVVMYVGSGPYGTQTVIEAPFTGSTVKYAPLFTEGLVSAGRP